MSIKGKRDAWGWVNEKTAMEYTGISLMKTASYLLDNERDEYSDVDEKKIGAKR